MASSREQRKRLINLHSSTLNSKPSGVLNLGEIAVEHSSVKDAKLYVETNGTSTSPNTLATFITEDKTKDLIASASTEVTKIIEDLTNIVLTGGSGDSIITVGVNDPNSGANTFTVTHKSGSTMSQSGFKKLSTDAYGHVTGGTDVVIGDVSGLTGFQTAVRNVETKLSVASGSGDFVTGITVNDHTITYGKANQESVSITADTNNGAFITGITTGGTRGHQLTLATGNLERTTGGTSNGNKVTDVTVNGKTITVTYGNEATLSVSTTGTGNAVTDVTVNDHAITLKKEKTFSENGHKHVGGDITGGTVGINYLPTATTVSSSSDNTTVPTSKAVQDAIDEANLYSVRYKGTTANVPSGSAKVGDEYIAASAFTISAERSGDGKAKSVEVGDYIVARTSGTTSKWDVKEKNLDGAVTTTGMTDGQIVIATGARTIKSQALSSIKVASATTSDSATTAVSAQTSNSATTLTGDYLKTVSQTAAAAGNNYTTSTVITDKAGNSTTIIGLSDYTIIDCGTY